jgi:predicted permease
MSPLMNVTMLVKELQRAARNLGRAPRFSLACVFTLALALAGTTTLLNVLETFVFRRLAVPAPDRLIGIYPTRGEFSEGFSAQALEALSERQQVLTGICGVTAGYGTLSVQFGSGAARQRPVEAVTGNCYEVLGVTPSMGRLITPRDAPLTGEPAQVVVISDRVWRREFGSSPDVLGRTVRLEGTPLTVIGVLPATYRGVNADEAPDVALPITLPWTLKLQPPLAMHAVGRLRPDTSFGPAAAHLSAIWPEVFMSSRPASTAVPSIPSLRAVPLESGFSVLRDRYRRPLFALAALAGCLLLLACVNVGGLALARLLNRRETLAVQLALGAGRSRLAVQLLCESLLIGVAAILLAIPIARWGAQWAVHLLWTGSRPFTFEATPLGTALLITACAGVLASLFVAVPGWIALAVQNWDLGARSIGHGAWSGQRRGVIAVQIALCVVLGFCAALFSANLSGLRQLPLGYEPGRLQWVRLDSISRLTFAPTIGYADALLSKLATLPGVELAAMSQGFGTTAREYAAPSPIRSDAGAGTVDALTDLVSPGFFRAASIPLQHGRDFTWSDVRSRATVTILNRALADRLFPQGDAVGRSVRLGQAEQIAAVIGIASDATPGDPRIQNVPQYYLPLGPAAPPAPALLLRLGAGSVTPAAVREIVEPMGRHEVVRVSMMDDEIERFLVQERLITSASLFFAVLAGVVSIAGLYAAMSQNITRRTREIGIRIAVGATPRAIRTLVLTEVGSILLMALGLGIPVALAAGQPARSLLSGTSSNTLTLLAVTGLAIAGAAVLVSAWPARRAARTPVATALRSE